VINKIFTIGREFHDLRSKWRTLSVYERFEQSIIGVLTLVTAVTVAVTTWQLLIHTFAFVMDNSPGGGDPEAFQGVFGMELTVLIALEFKHTLMVVKHHQRAIVEVCAVVLIALLALVRRFFILDLYKAAPGMIAALALATVALGVVLWPVTTEAPPENNDSSV
jgi:uncharacterized membrane protein (DUF373 family)